MGVTMPKIEVTFRQKAASLISRSARGVAILLVRDDTDKTFTHKQYSDLSALEADKARYTGDNYSAISDMLAFAPYQSHVFRLDTDGTLGDALAEVARTVKTGWITIAGMSSNDAAALASWVKAQAAKAKSYKCIVYNVSPLPDDMHVVNFVNSTVTYLDERGKRAGSYYLPSLLAILACCNVERGCTNYLCSDLAAVEEVEDNDAAVGSGKFILFNDEDGQVRIGQGINSMTTTDGNTKTEDMQFIETVEAMDLMRDDISSVFRGTYLGNYRNSRDNQMLFIAALNNSYFRELAQDNILDPDYANGAAIDVESQRASWLASGKSEASEWDDDKVKAMPFKRAVYLQGNVKILGSMTDLKFPINLF